MAQALLPALGAQASAHPASLSSSARDSPSMLPVSPGPCPALACALQGTPGSSAFASGLWHKDWHFQLAALLCCSKSMPAPSLPSVASKGPESLPASRAPFASPGICLPCCLAEPSEMCSRSQMCAPASSTLRHLFLRLTSTGTRPLAGRPIADSLGRSLFCCPDRCPAGGLPSAVLSSPSRVLQMFMTEDL